MINYEDVFIKVNLDAQEITFDHNPKAEDENFSSGKVTFECHKSEDGDGLITPIENLLECFNFKLHFDNNIEQPQNYERELLKIIIEKSDLT
jgi:hypothetical protein